MKPYNPTSFEIESDNGNFIGDVSKMKLHLEPEQEKSYIIGEVLAERMKDKGLNSNTLKYLLDNPEIIPDEWKGKYVHFFGTILRNSNGNRYVLYLYWHVGKWDWYYYWLEDVWDAINPSAVLASTLDSEPKNSSESLPLELEINGITYIRK